MTDSFDRRRFFGAMRLVDCFMTCPERLERHLG